MRTMLRAMAIVWGMQFLSLPIGATQMTFGFDGHLNYINCASGQGNCPNYVDIGGVEDQFGNFSAKATGRFSIDTEAIDLSPDPLVGLYVFSGQGSGLSITMGNLTFFTDTFRINVLNDQFGGFCGAGQRRDLISVFSELGSSIFDSCDTSALLSDANVHLADLARLGPYSTGPGEGLIVGPGGGVPFQALGNPERIYRTPEPGTAALLGVALAALPFVARRKRTGRR